MLIYPEMHNWFEIAGFPSAAANLVTTDVFWHHNGQMTDQDPSFDIFSSDDEVFEGMSIKPYLVPFRHMHLRAFSNQYWSSMLTSDYNVL